VATKRELPKRAVKENKTAVERRDGGDQALQMELPEFVTKFRQRVQANLWERADRSTVGDLVKLTELEREITKYSESKRPRELRVVWINKNQSTT
jgi:hypothetical protein